jgi:hypothetical protein
LKSLNPDELELIEKSLDALVRLLDIQALEASPLITIEGNLEDQEE